MLEGRGQPRTYARSSGSPDSFSPCTRRMYVAERSLSLVSTHLASPPPLPPSGPSPNGWGGHPPQYKAWGGRLPAGAAAQAPRRWVSFFIARRGWRWLVEGPGPKTALISWLRLQGHAATGQASVVKTRVCLVMSKQWAVAMTKERLESPSDEPPSKRLWLEEGTRAPPSKACESRPARMLPRPRATQSCLPASRRVRHRCRSWATPRGRRGASQTRQAWRGRRRPLGESTPPQPQAPRASSR